MRFYFKAGLGICGLGKIETPIEIRKSLGLKTNVKFFECIIFDIC